ncbi:GTPase Era [Geobacter pelophilus]|uniref:GTPase Era n=1 Tax=Geoanaerobacter pelophilus TaxID=60036 RepID=A0AAW4L0I3_9BACT|nr:GTPase Era [Geoanaerobacter pelophilus]MBT0662990.1 GTPase Era [Geoanaerobacter pelophilus]
MSEKFRSGFVAIIGRPNVGKSTLLNCILGEKLVITSDKPQTTRNRIQGIHNVEGGQIVFIDTPGIHKGRSRLNRYMVDEAGAALEGVDVVLFLVDATAKPVQQFELLQERLGRIDAPVILIVNKIDLISREQLILKLAEYGKLHNFREIVPLSAAKGEGVDRLDRLILPLLPEGPAYFPDDILTDAPERFVVAEIIREKVFRHTGDEIPYAVAVNVEEFDEGEEENGLIRISAVISVERETQKGIVIGKHGAMLKKVGTLARKEIEQLLGARVFLELFVRVRKDWTGNKNMMKELGYE